MSVVAQERPATTIVADRNSRFSSKHRTGSFDHRQVVLGQYFAIAASRWAFLQRRRCGSLFAIAVPYRGGADCFLVLNLGSTTICGNLGTNNNDFERVGPAPKTGPFR
jgi:hypothetical protein